MLTASRNRHFLSGNEKDVARVEHVFAGQRRRWVRIQHAFRLLRELRRRARRGHEGEDRPLIKRATASRSVSLSTPGALVCAGASSASKSRHKTPTTGRTSRRMGVTSNESGPMTNEPDRAQRKTGGNEGGARNERQETGGGQCASG